MTNMNKDYYKILGVCENCTDAELKSAYRKLARKWHPDVAGNTADVVNTFKEINEAYEVLSDNSKRADYDRLNRYYNYSSTKKTESKTTTEPNFKNTKEKKEETKHSSFNFNWEDFLSKYKEYTNKFEQDRKENHQKHEEKRAEYGYAKRGKDINTDVEVTIAEAINGTTKVINMLNTEVCSHCGGRKFVNGSTCSHCKGKGETSDYKRFTVKIPAGVKDNSKIRLSGEGTKGQYGGKNGDLYITVHIKSPLDYKTDGNNILKTVTIAPYEAVLGGNISVKTLDGNVNVRITPNTQNGQKIRLSGCGLNLNGKIGDMILTVEIQIPKNLSPEEISLYKRLQEISSQSVR